jgi:hypothetical protein
VIVINDPKTANDYGQVFDQAFSLQQKLQSSGKVATAFSKLPLASQYFDCSGHGLPDFKVAFSPHANPAVSMKEVADAIKNAKSSVIFAVMELQGGGSVLQQLSTLNKRKDIFSYGMDAARAQSRRRQGNAGRHAVQPRFQPARRVRHLRLSHQRRTQALSGGVQRRHGAGDPR